MKSFPMFIRTSDRRVIVVGGGEQAAQKTRLILKTDARIVLVAPELDDELQGLVLQGRAAHHAGPVTPAFFSDCAMTFVATGCVGTDVAFHALAKAGGALTNVVDRPELCDAITPAIVDRDPVVVAIGTEGTAPVLGRSIKTQIETMLPPRLGGLAALAGRLRGAVAARLPRETHRGFWSWVFNGQPASLHHQGAEERAAELIKKAIADQRPPQDAGKGHIALVGAGPGARDLLTLRAVKRLQEADVIFYDRLVDPDVLELARRDAERVFVGKEVGANAWPQDRICAVVVAEARKGRRVVRLKSGDPSVFGRVTEELTTADAAGIPVEIVPGITAATAAAASSKRSLTERGETDTVILTTGSCRDGDGAPDWANHVRPGTSLVFYMGVGAARSIRAELLRQGARSDTCVEIAADVATASERHLTCALADLPETLASEGINGKALLTVRFPKTAAQSAVIAA